MKKMQTLFVLVLAGLLALGTASAQGNVMFEEAGMEGDLRTSELVGAPVYTMANAAAPADAAAMDQRRFQVDALPQDWEQIATVEDLVVGMDGNIRGLLVDVGGFLGIGARTVLMHMDSVQIATQTGAQDVYVVVNATREDLEAAPEYMHYDRTGAMQDGAAQDGAVAQPADPAAPRVGVPQQPQEGFAAVDRTALTVDQLRGADVYDINNQRVSSISDVVLGDGESVQAVLIDVGGFLGIGARTVAVPMDQVEIQGTEAGGDLRVFLNITQEQLEALPEHVN
jgi:sporulation protein YlmC with PRC-barrel domain